MQMKSDKDCCFVFRGGLHRDFKDLVLNGCQDSGKARKTILTMLNSEFSFGVYFERL